MGAEGGKSVKVGGSGKRQCQSHPLYRRSLWWRTAGMVNRTNFVHQMRSSVFGRYSWKGASPMNRDKPLKGGLWLRGGLKCVENNHPKGAWDCVSGRTKSLEAELEAN